MLDKIFATISMLGVVAFLGVVMGFVREPDLWIVIILVLTIAIKFFCRDFRNGGVHTQTSEKPD